MSGLTIDQSNIFTLVLESVIYGIFFPLFLITLWILCRVDRNMPTFQKVMVCTVCLMFLIATAHLIISIMRAFDAYSFGGLGGFYYLNIAEKKQTIADALYVAQTVIGDAFIITRVYIIWNRSFAVIILPSLLLLGWLSVAVVTSFKFAHATPENQFSDFLPWVTADYSLTLGVSITSTILISWRIWRTHKGGKEAGLANSRKLIPVIIAIVESAAIYSAAVLAILVDYLVDNSKAGWIEILTPLIGVAFSLIVVQVHIKRINETTTNMNMPSRLTALSFAPGGTGSGFASQSGQQHTASSPSTLYPMTPLQTKGHKHQWSEKREEEEFTSSSHGARAL